MRKIVWLTILLGLSACSATQASPAVFSQDPRTPLPWASLNLTGRLVFILYQANGNQIDELDLASGRRITLFQAPENSWLSAASVSPDGRQIVMAYSPPPKDNQVQFGYSDLSLLPYGSANSPTLLTGRARAEESFYDPIWSPDGKEIYFAHFIHSSQPAGVDEYRIERVALDGKSEVLVEDALWPKLSRGGTQLAYLTFHANSSKNDLHIADRDGKNSHPALPPGAFAGVDAHLFSQRGDALIFSAVNHLLSSAHRSWLDGLLGVEIASAHSLPSDWYRVSIAGGQVERLTHLNDTGMDGALSPDGQHMAFISASGLYIMDQDSGHSDGSHQNGGLLTLIFPFTSSFTLVGTIDWIP